MTTMAVSMFAGWSQENFFRYRREHYGLDRLVEYGTEPVPDAMQAVNPAWRKRDSQIRSKTGQRQRLVARFGALTLAEDPTESELHGLQRRLQELRDGIQILDLDSGAGKQLARIPRITLR